ncbi:PAS domain-containing sensor histidine kinase [Balneatrix alpica]|uniref:PAS domain-containing sensor histidine kinase n=1 Tax=Balneatrix alpica TaxID=75684 RepID=UPI0027387C77|nr:ATP-binding protein [Balneatrix alpica]
MSASSLGKGLIQALEQHAPGIFYLKDANLRFTHVSHNFLQLLGLEKEQVLGQSARSIFAELADPIESNEFSVLHGLKLTTEETYPHPHPQQAPLTFWVEKFPLLDEQQNLLGICTIGHDISEAKQMQHASRELIGGLTRRYGEAFLQHCSQSLQRLLNADYLMIARLNGEAQAVPIINLGPEGKALPLQPYALHDTPCAQTGQGYICVHQRSVADLYPRDLMLAELGIQAYIGTPLRNEQRQVMGIIVAMFKQPLQDPQFARSLFELFADRIASEIERGDAEQALIQANEALEQRVRERTRELEFLNKELESFAYSASHDLRTPLRALDGFSHALLEDYSGQLDGLGTLYLQRMRLAAQQMSRLLDGLLELSRVSRHPLQQQEVNLSDIAEEICSQLRLSEPQRRVNVEIQPTMTSMGDPRLLYSMLQNLIGNAWKYSRPRPEASIEIGQTADQVFYVRDNGIGMPADQINRIFAAFQRLHSQDEFEGSGIGLATVQRILQRHGGHIWAESQPDQGSTFYFILAGGKTSSTLAPLALDNARSSKTDAA